MAVISVAALGVLLAVAFVRIDQLHTDIRHLKDGAQAQSETQINFNQSTEWVSCQLLTGNQFISDSGGEFFYMDASHAKQIQDECSAPSDAWVLCVHVAMAELTDSQLTDFDVSTARSIADQCKTEVSR